MDKDKDKDKKNILDVNYKAVKLILESYPDIHLGITQGFRELFSASTNTIQVIPKSLPIFQKAISEVASSFTEVFREVYSLRPLTEYLEKNKDRIQNLQNSSDRIINQLCRERNITEDQALNLMDELIEKGKITISDDWIFELAEEEKVYTTKPTLTLSDIITLISIIATLVSLTSSSNEEINIDNSITNIETQINGDVHYYAEEIIEISDDALNEYIIVNDTRLYESDSIDSVVITTLNSGDKVNRILIEEGSDLMLVAILTEDNTVKNTGWIKIDDATLID